MAVFVAFKSTYNKHFAMQITMLISHHTYKTTNYANTQQIKYYVHTHNSKKTIHFSFKRHISADNKPAEKSFSTIRRPCIPHKQ